MAIKSGQFIHDANGFVVDRIQTGGVSSLNIPEERIAELGNWQTVAVVRDIPDLSFEAESLDVSTEFEALLLGRAPSAITAGPSGTKIDFATAVPLDVISPFKAGSGSFTIVGGVVVPYLTLESATYRFGVKQNATQSFSLKGDSYYYGPGTPRFKDMAVSGTSYAFGETAVAYTESGSTIYALSVCLKNPTTGAFKRLFIGTDYTNTSAGITLLATPDVAYTRLHLTYVTATQDTTTYTQSVHEGTSVKPAAVRGKDIDVYVSSGGATPVLTRWTGVQNFEVTRRVNLDADEEFGNTHYVSQDYDIAEVNGSITIKPRDVAELLAKVAQVANVATNVVVGPYTSTPLALELRIKDPDTGTLLKTLYVPDARFEIPALQGRVQQKQQVTFNFQSDGGTLEVYRGAR